MWPNNRAVHNLVWLSGNFRVLWGSWLFELPKWNKMSEKLSSQHSVKNNQPIKTKSEPVHAAAKFSNSEQTMFTKSYLFRHWIQRRLLMLTLLPFLSVVHSGLDQEMCDGCRCGPALTNTLTLDLLLHLFFIRPGLKYLRFKHIQSSSRMKGSWSTPTQGPFILNSS